MEDVRELMGKYKLSEFIPENAETEFEAEYKLKIEIELDGTYYCRYDSIHGDQGDAYFMGDNMEIAEGNGYTLDECLHSLRNFIDDHTISEYPFPEKVIDELLKVLHEITIAESPKDMWDLAADTLKKYGKTAG